MTTIRDTASALPRSSCANFILAKENKRPHRLRLMLAYQTVRIPKNIQSYFAMKKVSFSLACSLLLASSALLTAQKAELGFMGGISLYNGDLAPKEYIDYLKEVNPAFGIFGRVNVNPYFSVRAGITQAKVTGDDINSFPSRGLNFRSNITELALTGEYSPFQLGGQRAKVVTAPYLYAGATVYRFNPQTLYDNNWIDLRPLGTEGQGLPGYEKPYSLTQIAVPIGAGIKFTVRQTWSLGIEFGARKLFNDYLDDITSAQVNYLDVLTGNGTLAATLSNPSIKEPTDATYRRGGEFQDWYYVGGVTLSFRLAETRSRSGRGLGCPEF